MDETIPGIKTMNKKEYKTDEVEPLKMMLSMEMPMIDSIKKENLQMAKEENIKIEEKNDNIEEEPQVEKIEEGAKTVLDSINIKENSYSKAYEICKNTTIYTLEGKELLQEEENQYLEDIMPTLYSIVQEVKKIIDNSLNRIDKIYITGTGSIINNIDLYFQEYFSKRQQGL